MTAGGAPAQNTPENLLDLRRNADRSVGRAYNLGRADATAELASVGRERPGWSQ